MYWKKPIEAVSRKDHQANKRKKRDQMVVAICLAIALFFWLLTKMSQVYTVVVPVRIVYDLPANKVLAVSAPGQATASLQANGWVLLRNSRLYNNLRFTMPVHNGPSTLISAQTIRTRLEASLHLTGISIAGVEYPTLSLQLDNKSSKTIPLSTVNLEAAPAKGFRIIKPLRLSTGQVRITGPSSVVDSLKEWPLENRRWTDCRQSFSDSVSLRAPSSAITFSISKVAVEVAVEPLTTKELFIPVKVINAAADSLRYFPRQVKVSCTVGISVYDSITADDFVLLVDLQDARLNNKQHTAPIIIATVPEGVEYVRLSNRSVEFLFISNK